MGLIAGLDLAITTDGIAVTVQIGIGYTLNSLESGN